MTRVLHVGPLPPPQGGVATALAAILYGLQGTDIHCRVLDTSRKTHWEIIGRVDIKDALRALITTIRLGGLARSSDVLHIHATDDVGFLRDAVLTVIGRATGTPVVLHIHGDFVSKMFPGTSLPTRMLFKYVLGMVAAVVVLDETFARRIEGVARNIHIVPNAHSFSPAQLDGFLIPRRLCSPLHLLFMGRVSAEKGCEDFVWLVHSLNSLGVNARGTIAGAPPTAYEEAWLNRVTRDSAFVRYVGTVTGNEKIRVLQQSHVFVLPSRKEVQSVAVIEALASGLPVVTTDVGCLSHLVHNGENGYVCAMGDRDGLLGAIRAACSNPDTYGQMSSNAFLSATQYAPWEVSHRLLAVYKSIRNSSME